MSIMTSKKQDTLDRRSFIKVSTALGGGLLLGFSWLQSCQPSTRAEIIPELELPESWQEINAFLKIGNNGVVTIFSPNPEIGQNVKTSMPMIVAEELDVNWEMVIVEQAPLDTEKYTRQVAGGSQSIRQGWEGLRRAGATAKALLILAAAEHWEVDPKTCTASKGQIRNETGETLDYGTLATRASELEPPEDIPLKSNTDFDIIGTDRGNVDLQKIITGKPLFGIDTKVEGMLHASVLRPPAFGQVLASYDDAATLEVSGVSGVVRFGDKIAVLASSSWAAMKGKKALVVEWKTGSALEHSEKHDEALLKMLQLPSENVRRLDGDPEKAMAEARLVLDRTYEAPFLPHNCLEPMNFFAHVTDEKVHCIGPIQTPEWTRKRIAELLKRDESSVTIMMTRMGGGFGRRLYGDFALEAAEISKLTQQPVQLLFTREDDMSAGTYRPASKYRIQAGVKDDQIVAYHLREACINGNMYGLIPNFFPAGAIDNYLVDNHQLESNITIGAWRAPYTNFLAFAEQTFFDELAEQMNVDPAQLRMDLYEKAKANQDDERMEWSPGRMQGVLQLVLDKSEYGKKGNDLFQGISVYYSHNTHVAEVAEVVLRNGQPMVTKVYCAVDCGIVINPIAARAQVEGGIIDGLGHALYGNLSFRDGVPQANNFNKFRLIRMPEVPEVEVHFVPSQEDPTGLGEPSLPPLGAAVANAIYRATGKRIYKQPLLESLELPG